MGLFDTLEQAAAGFAGQSGDQDGQAVGATSGGPLAAVLQMVQSHPGGVQGIVQQFEGAGLGGVAQSWLGNGGNAGVSGEDVQNALGSGPVSAVASQLGVSPDEAAGHISQFLPLILDHLSPNGEAPQGGAMGEIEGLLSRFGGGGGA